MKGKDRNYAEVLGQKLLDSAKRLSTYEKKKNERRIKIIFVTEKPNCAS